jgi:hypothetical protein
MSDFIVIYREHSEFTCIPVNRPCYTIENFYITATSLLHFWVHLGRVSKKYHKGTEHRTSTKLRKNVAILDNQAST